MGGQLYFYLIIDVVLLLVGFITGYLVGGRGMLSGERLIEIAKEKTEENNRLVKEINDLKRKCEIFNRY